MKTYQEMLIKSLLVKKDFFLLPLHNYKRKFLYLNKNFLYINQLQEEKLRLMMQGL